MVIKIGDYVCNTIDYAPANSVWITVDCVSDSKHGITGSNIRLYNNLPIIVICGIKVSGHYIDVDIEALPG